tara:strand:- start:1025 stop:2647 length:1623 start_codon:yes stop_codon:yes gene_type:complete
MKYFSFKRYKFSTFIKYINNIRDNFFEILGFIDFRKITKYLDIRKVDFSKLSKFLDIKTYNIKRLKKINFLSNKFIFFHIPAAFVFFGFLYLFIPTFFNYDKSNILKTLCKNKNFECLIKGKISYNFYPTPRIKIKDIVVNELFKKKNTLATIEQASIKLSIKNLLAKDKHKFKKLELNNFKINFNINATKKYQDLFKERVYFLPIVFKKGEIIFYEEKDYVAIIKNANLNLKFIEDSIEAKLEGDFLDDNIFINLNTKKIDKKTNTEVLLKMSNLNLLTKINLFNSNADKKALSGNILIKKDKNKITAIIDYKDNELIINKSNLRNTFIDGKLDGKIVFLPYFNFDLDVNLNSINFTRLSNYFLSLDNEQKEKLFNINNKINGNLILSSDKIYSSYNLMKSFESRIKFNNGSILIERFLANLGKLGAADILGAISNDKKFTTFKFESNIFVDNQKKFLSKFGIYNKKSIPSNLFISGNFDLNNPRVSFYEISNDKKFNNEDINYIEKEFNNLMLENGYQSLFHFPKLKEFIKSVSDDEN